MCALKIPSGFLVVFHLIQLGGRIRLGGSGQKINRSCRKGFLEPHTSSLLVPIRKTTLYFTVGEKTCTLFSETRQKNRYHDSSLSSSILLHLRRLVSAKRRQSAFCEPLLPGKSSPRFNQEGRAGFDRLA